MTSYRYSFLYLAFLLCVGCSPDVKSPNVTPPVGKAEADAIVALKAAGAVIKTDDGKALLQADAFKAPPVDDGLDNVDLGMFE